jgi:hypothetical protein
LNTHHAVTYAERGGNPNPGNGENGHSPQTVEIGAIRDRAIGSDGGRSQRYGHLMSARKFGMRIQEFADSTLYYRKMEQTLSKRREYARRGRESQRQ